MECPHLNEAAKLTRIDGKDEKNKKPEFCCSVCNEKNSPWICVSCGVINCGRYVNGHAEEHFTQEKHPVCMDCENFAAFCYICDDFVTNDSKPNQLSLLRQHFKSLNQPAKKYPQRKRKTKNNSQENLDKKSKIDTNNYCKAKVAGLRNLGNTCFMNAVLQSLSNIEQFCGYFKKLPALDPKLYKNGKKFGGSSKSYVTRSNSGEEDDISLLAEELRKTLISLWQGSKSAISPESLFAVVWRVVPRFRGYQQQDAHEFLRYMLDRLHTELLNILSNNPNNGSSHLNLGPKNQSTIVTTIFGGVLQNEVTCLVCGTNSKKHDPFLDLSLDIPQGVSVEHRASRSRDSEPKPCHLLDCLSSFTELEELTETELYHCHTCKKKQPSTKQFWVRRLPNVLCLHLKRFRWNNYFRIKLDNYVEFPIQGLDMSRFLLENMHETRGSSGGSTLYDLAAVIVHHGSGAGSGHYTAYGTHEGCWHHFNDSTVSPTDSETVAKSKAYILFYIRREVNLNPVLSL